MKNVYKIGAIATAIAAMFSAAAYADPAETKGGITIKTEDGRFEAKFGGRIHFDGNIVKEDSNAAFGSSANPAQSGFYFRRIYLTASGKLYGWKYKIEPDFAPNNASGATAIAFQDVYLATDLGPGELQIGQRKPFRAMEDLTSSNDVLMIERPFASSSGGTFKGGVSGTNSGDREFQDGLFYHGNGDLYTWGVSGTTLRRDNTAGTEGWSSSARGTFTPINAEGSIIHVGVNTSYERPGNNQSAAATGTPMAVGAGGYAYAGRRGPTVNLALTSAPITSIGLEYANAFGPWFAQAEFIQQHLNADYANAGMRAHTQTVQAYYVQTSFLITGETKPYKKADGVFGSAKPSSPNGAWEVTARYDHAQNKDEVAGGDGNACAAGATVTACKISAITIGTNYYANSNVRFMLNYILGTQDRGDMGKDKPKTLAARFQLSF